MRGDSLAFEMDYSVLNHWSLSDSHCIVTGMQGKLGASILLDHSVQLNSKIPPVPFFLSTRWSCFSVYKGN